MIPLKDIKVKSAKIRRENKEIVISPADPSESYLKRDVSQIINELQFQFQIILKFHFIQKRQNLNTIKYSMLN